MKFLQLRQKSLVNGIIALCIISFAFILFLWPREEHEHGCTIDNDNCLVYRPHVKLAFITSYFHPTNDNARASELDVCLASLIANPFVSQLHILVEAKDQPFIPSFATDSPKVIQHSVSRRPFVGDFFQYICDHPGLQDHRVFFANSDISIDSTFEYFTKISDKVFDSTFYGITRYRLEPSRGMDYHPLQWHGSTDTWGFNPAMLCQDKDKLHEIVSNLNYTLGHLGGENRMLYEIKRQYPDINTFNPCQSVRTVHVHASEKRSNSWLQIMNEDGKSEWIPNIG